MKHAVKLTAVTAVMLAAVVACGRKDDAGAKAADDKASAANITSATVAAKASCNMLTELGTCNEYRNGQQNSLGLEKSLCEGFHGKFQNAPCPTDGQVGSCAMSDGEVKRYYGSKVAGEHSMTVAEAKSDCESELVKGKFLTDPNAASANAPAEEPKPAAAVIAPQAAPAKKQPAKK